MASGYFDISANNGFTLRTFWEEKNGTVTPTNVQLQSKEFGGTWHPEGTIKVDGTVALTMSYYTPATHSFKMSGVGDAWVEMLGSKPASVGPITDKTKTTIEVDVELYCESETLLPRFIGSAEIRLTTGLVQIRTANGIERHRAYIKRGGKIVHAAAVVKHGGKIKYCT